MVQLIHVIPNEVRDVTVFANHTSFIVYSTNLCGVPRRLRGSG
jgi:hypothetical protein